jgi:hypothetical protein
MTPISQEDRELLNSLETYQLLKNSPFNRKTAESSAGKRLWEALLCGLMTMCVMPWVFGLFILAVGFTLHYFFVSISWLLACVISVFRILGKA